MKKGIIVLLVLALAAIGICSCGKNAKTCKCVTTVYKNGELSLTQEATYDMTGKACSMMNSEQTTTANDVVMVTKVVCQ